ncbi:MAG: zinc finger domain-containing protein [Candidatus Ranarchaeia archaeon]
MSELKTPLCDCCGRTIQPTTDAVNFKCPSCGELTIWRCETCRKRGNNYTCRNCGFEGP